LDAVRSPIGGWYFAPPLSEQIVRRVRAQSHLPSHPYEVRFPERFPLIDADPERIQQLLLNLLENAAKYSPPRTLILVEGRVEGDALAVSVVDEVPGLTGDQAAHIFDKFFRVDSGLSAPPQSRTSGISSDSR